MSGISPISTRIAIDLRHCWPKDKPVLYHGTPRCSDVLSSDCLLASDFGDMCVSFTRRPEVAVYFAMMARDAPHDGGVLVLDRRLLASRYPIDLRHCDCWGPYAVNADDEAEEAIWANVTDLRQYLIGVVPIAAELGDASEVAA